MIKLINFYEDIMCKIYQRKYEKFYKNIYKLSKISYRLEIKERNRLNKCKISKSDKKRITNYWKKYTKDYKIYAHKFYKDKNGKKNPRFIPDDIFAEYIEQYFNNVKLAPAFADKNYFDLILNGFSMPKTYVHYIDNSFLDKDYNIISKNKAYSILINAKTIVVKKSIGSSGGDGVQIIENVTKKDLENIFNNPDNTNLLFQERIKQCEYLDRFTKSSVNTIRIYSYWFNNKIYLSNAVLRVGRNGALIDNASSGGVFFQVSEDDELIPVPRDIYGLEDKGYKLSEDIKKNTKLYFMKDVRDFVTQAATRLGHFKILSWDIAISEDSRPILVEYNVANNIPDITQMYSEPFFGDLTDEILEEVFKNYNRKKDGLKVNQFI